MENQQQPEQNNRMKRLLPYLFIGVFAFVALVSLYFAYQANMKMKTTPPDYKKVVAVTGQDISVSVESDGTSMFFEHNGERLSLTNRITDLMVGTEYTFTFTNNSGVKQGVFIPALKESVVAETAQTVSISIRFDNPGTYYFMGNVYQTGWDGLKSGFDVGVSAVETPPPITPNPGTITPTLTPTDAPSTKGTPTVTPTATPTLTLTPTPTQPSGVFTSCADVTEIPQIECEALVALYNSTNGPGWTPHPGWLQTTTPCGWYGLGCSADNQHPRHIIQMNLQQSNLVGQIPAQIGNLSQIEFLFLSTNTLTGSIPIEITELNQLIDLTLSNNQLTGSIPQDIGNLRSLLYFKIDNNSLTGDIPPSIVNLTRLKIFNANSNQLSGTILASLGYLTELTGLGLENNLFTGHIPSQFGNLVNLTTLHLKNNQLSGTVPSSFSNLIHISGVNLSIRDNNLTGVENQSVCPWLVAHTQSNWWQLQNPPIASDPCLGAQPVAARTSRVALPKTMPLPNSNILERITLFFQQLLQNVFGK